MRRFLFYVCVLGLALLMTAGCGPTETDYSQWVSGTQTAVAQLWTSTPAPTGIPTATSTPEPSPTRTSTITATPDPWVYWPDLEEMPEATPILDPLYTDPVNDLDAILRQHRVPSFLRSLLEPYTGDNAATVILDELSNGDLAQSAIQKFYNELYVYPFPPALPFRFYVDESYWSTSIYPGGVVNARMYSVDPEGENEYSVFPMFDVERDQYIYLMSTPRMICLFLEDATLRGFGLAAQPGGREKAFLTLINFLGDEAYYSFYCSNFDPDSSDFLAITRHVGEIDLFEVVQNLLEE